MTTESARQAAAQGFAGLSGLSEPTPVRGGAGELSAFTDKGYSTAFAVIGVHRWFHTKQDTLERVDAELLLRTAGPSAHDRAAGRVSDTRSSRGNHEGHAGTKLTKDVDVGSTWTFTRIVLMRLRVEEHEDVVVGTQRGRSTRGVKSTKDVDSKM
jgi:hypothetical protein